MKLQVLFCMVKSVWIVCLIGLLAGKNVAIHSNSIQLTDPQRSTLAAPHGHMSTPTPDFSMFVGTWVAHSAGMIFSADGTALFEARTYRWCGPGVAFPCDSIDARGMITNGDQERILFSRVTASTAYGTIIASNFHPTGLTVTVDLQPHDTLRYASTTVIRILCGPNSPPGECGA